MLLTGVRGKKEVTKKEEKKKDGVEFRAKNSKALGEGIGRSSPSLLSSGRRKIVMDITVISGALTIWEDSQLPLSWPLSS